MKDEIAIVLHDKGEKFADEVRVAHANGFPIVMMHENDPEKGGCEFAHFFETTPQDLISDGLYKALACAWYPEPFRQVSVAQVAIALGAEEPLSMSPSNQAKRFGRKVLRTALGSLGGCLTRLGDAFSRAGSIDLERAEGGLATKAWQNH